MFLVAGAVLHGEGDVAERRFPVDFDRCPVLVRELPEIGETAADEFQRMKAENLENPKGHEGETEVAVGLPHPVRNQARDVVEASHQIRPAAAIPLQAVAFSGQAGTAFSNLPIRHVSSR